MSYYTVIEDVVIDEAEIIREDNKNLSELPAFNDWATLIVLIIIVPGFLSSMMYTISLDSLDVKKMKQIEEVDQSINDSHGKKKLDKYSMMSWVFKRRLYLEKPCQENLRACCQKFNDKSEVKVSTWILFKLYLSHLHPIFSL
jgi:hypothetical protein